MVSLRRPGAWSNQLPNPSFSGFINRLDLTPFTWIPSEAVSTRCKACVEVLFYRAHRPLPSPEAIYHDDWTASQAIRSRLAARIKPAG